jgi:hypothetical protein
MQLQLQLNMEEFTMDGRIIRNLLTAVAAVWTLSFPLYGATGGLVENQAVAQSDERAYSQAVTQAAEHTHDLAIVSIKAPKKVSLSAKKPTVVQTVKVAIQNRSTYIETIPDQNTLNNLVNLSVVEQTGGSSCTTPVAVLHTGKPQPALPVTLKPNKKLKVVFDVTFTCAIDPLKGSGHEDFYYIAQVDASALDGQADVYPASDVCPRTPVPVVDGSPTDKGCGAKLPNKILGGPVLSDVVLKSVDSNPTIGFANGIQYTTNNIRVGKTEIGDLNGDGLNDAVTMESGGFGQRLLFYFQNFSNSFDNPVVQILPDTQISSFTLGDVNGDGTTDVVVSGSSISALSGYLGRILIIYQDPVTGKLLFPGTELVVSSNRVGSVVVADLNSDGRNDIAVLGSWEQTSGMGNIAIFYQNNNGTMATEVIYDATPVQYTGELYAADMDNDGDNDLILQTGLLQLGIIKQDETQTPPKLSLTPDYYQVQTSYWPSFNAFSVGDLNDDGTNDVVVLDPGNNGFLNLFYQNANGVLDGPSLTPQASAALYGIEVADVNENGLNEILGDLVDATFDPNTGGNVFVFDQLSNPPYSIYTTYSFGTISGGGSDVHEALSVGDVTGDGYKDAVVTWGDEGLYVLRAQIQ